MPIPEPDPVVLPPADDMYDTLMEKIEPELVSTVIPTLMEKYKDETPKQAKVRVDRYNKAFAEYEKQMNANMDQLDQQVSLYQRHALASAEQKSRMEEETELAELEKNFSSPPSPPAQNAAA